MKQTFLLFILMLTSLGARALTFEFGSGKYETLGNTDPSSGYPTVQCIGLSSERLSDTSWNKINLRGIVEYNGTKYHCTKIQDRAFYGNTQLQYLNLGYGIKLIGNLACANCSNLKEVKIPSSVTAIGTNAFAGVSSSLLVNFPRLNSLPTFSSGCFSSIYFLNVPTPAVKALCQNNSFLNNVVKYYQITPQYAYDYSKGHDSNNTYYYVYTKEPTSTSEGESALVGVSGTKVELNSSSVDIYYTNSDYPKDVVCKSIAKTAFSSYLGANPVTSVYIDRAVTISDSAFYQSSGITKVYLDGVTVGKHAFAHCSSISDLTILSGSVYSRAFESATNLGTLTLGSNYSSPTLYINEQAFSKNSFNHVVLKTNVNRVSPFSFQDCLMLETIEVNSGNAYYSSSNNMLFNKNQTELLFVPQHYAYTGMNEKNFPGTMTSIGEYAFMGNNKIVSIDIPYGVTSIGRNAFYNSKFSSINIPSSVTSYPSETLIQGCTNLKYIGVNTRYLPSKENFAVKVTNNNNDEYFSGTIYHPVQYDVGEEKDYYYNTANSEPGAYDLIYSMDGQTNNPLCFTLNNATKTAMLVPGKGTGAFIRPTSTSITIPESITYRGDTYTVTALDGGAFYNNTTVESIILPETIEVFKGNTGSVIMYSENLLIDGYQFKGCTNLTTLKLPSSLKYVPHQCFANTKNLKKVYFPYGVLEIGWRVFSGSGVTEVLFPSSLERFRGHEIVDAKNLSIIILNVPYKKLGDADGNGSYEYSRYTNMSTMANYFSMPSDLTVYLPASEFEAALDRTNINYEPLTTWQNDNLFSRYTLKIGAYDVISSNNDENRKFYLTVTKATTGSGTGNAGEAMYTRGPASYSGTTVTVGKVMQDDRYSDRFYNVNNIGPSAFSSATSLKKVTFNNTIDEIPDLAFAKTLDLTEFPFDSSLKRIGVSAFARSGLTESVIIPGENLREIGREAFYGCQALKELIIKHHPKFQTTDTPIFGYMDSSFKCYIDHRQFPYYYTQYTSFGNDMSNTHSMSADKDGIPYSSLIYPCVIPENDWVTLSFPTLYDSEGTRAEKYSVSLKGLGIENIYFIGDPSNPFYIGAIKMENITPQFLSARGSSQSMGYLAHLKKDEIYRLDLTDTEDYPKPSYNYLKPGAFASEITKGVPILMSCDAEYCSKYGVYTLVPSNGDNLPCFKKMSKYTGEVGTAFLTFQGTNIPSPLPEIVYLYDESQGILKGDVNFDGKVNITDVVAIIQTIAGDSTYMYNADVNRDNDINITDIVTVINIIAGNQ